MGLNYDTFIIMPSQEADDRYGTFSVLVLFPYFFLEVFNMILKEVGLKESETVNGLSRLCPNQSRT